MENMEYILSLAGAALSILAALLTIAVKFVKALKELKAREGKEEIGKKLPELIAEAEKFEEYSGAEKKEYVLDKVAEFAKETGIVKTLSYDSAWISSCDAIGRNIFRNYRVCCDDRSVADVNARHYGDILPDPDIIAYNGIAFERQILQGWSKQLPSSAHQVKRVSRCATHPMICTIHHKFNALCDGARL